MPIDLGALRSRRSLLAAVGAAMAGAVVATASGAQRVLAAGDDGKVMHVGDTFEDVRKPLTLVNRGGPVLNLLSDGNGTTILAYTDGGDGYAAVQGQARKPGGQGVAGLAETGNAIDGYSRLGNGVAGSSQGGHGLVGQSRAGYGVHGKSADTYGVYGESDSSYAIVGLSVASVGVFGLSDTASGVIGQSGSSTGVVGQSVTGRGGRFFSGSKAQIRLQPSPAGTHPIAGQTGDLFVDKAGRLWYCRRGGKPAAWKQVA